MRLIDSMGDLSQWCICGHMFGEHLGSYSSHDGGICNSRGSKFAGKKIKLDNVRGIPNDFDVCHCINFFSIEIALKQLVRWDTHGESLTRSNEYVRMGA